MSATPFTLSHDHVFLGEGHDSNAHKTWAVIVLCTVVMIVEIVGGWRYGSLALIADGLHMSTHAAAMLIAAWAYRYARKHAQDPRFSFGTGKVGDLSGFSSAIILAMIALLIGYEAISRLIAPIPIDFNQAIAIAFLGPIVNIVSAWLLSGGDHGHSHGHSHDHAPGHTHRDDERKIVDTPSGQLQIDIYEDNVPPRFRVSWLENKPSGTVPSVADLTIGTLRPGGERQTFAFRYMGGYWESVDIIPEPHAFVAQVQLQDSDGLFTPDLSYTEPEGHEHPHAHHRDHNMRAAFVHVAADAAVSVLAILGLTSGKFFGLNFMDPVMGIVGALVIANWSFGLIRDTGGILLDMNPSRDLSQKISALVRAEGDELADLHLWRLGPGHLGAIVAIQGQSTERDAGHYRQLLSRFPDLSHVTVEVAH